VSQTRNPKQEFKELVKRKEVLEEMLSLAGRVEHLLGGLQATVQMGKTSSEIPKEAQDLLAALPEAIKGQPSAKLKDGLANLETRMAKSMEQVLALADQELDERMGEEAIRCIDEFRRSSKTALALRVLLNNRNEITKPIKLPVQLRDLQIRVAKVDTRKKEVTQKVAVEIVKVHDDSMELLKTPGLPDGIKSMLADTMKQMKANLAHLKSGGSFEKLPYSMEILEVESVEEEIEAIPEVLPVFDVEEIQVEEIEVKDDGSLIGQLGSWLNTSVDVSWKEAGEQAKAKK
jgi:hypothetical protein